METWLWHPLLQPPAQHHCCVQDDVENCRFPAITGQVGKIHDSLRPEAEGKLRGNVKEATGRVAHLIERLVVKGVGV
jgi:hypothetical protein